MKNKRQTFYQNYDLYVHNENNRQPLFRKSNLHGGSYIEYMFYALRILDIHLYDYCLANLDQGIIQKVHNAGNFEHTLSIVSHCFETMYIAIPEKYPTPFLILIRYVLSE